MLKSIAAGLAVASLMAVAAGPSPARAEILYPWCAQYSGEDMSGTNCGFVTLAQCMATVSGIGGFCQENPAYPPATPKPKRQRAPRN